jgi:hypothetical protein
MDPSDHEAYGAMIHRGKVEAREPPSVYVVMAGDYPEIVFTTEAIAKEYCTKKNAESKTEPWATPIFYRAYQLPLIGGSVGSP